MPNRRRPGLVRSAATAAPAGAGPDAAALSPGAPLLATREAFAVPEGVAYFNTASLAPMLVRALEAGQAALRRRAAPWTIGSADWFDDTERLRALVGRLLGTDAEGVALVPATSYGMAVAARNLADRVAAGRRGGSGATGEVLVLADDYPSSVYTWRRFAAETGARLVAVGAEPGQTWTDAVLARLDTPVRVVSVPTVRWTDGAALDLGPVARRARELGAHLVVDASQSLGAVPLDVTALRPDFLVSVGYKWLLGPVGRSYLWVAEHHRDGRPLEENWIARLGSDDFAALVAYDDRYRPGARRFDHGQSTMFELMPMAVAALEQVVEWGADRVAAALAGVTETVARRLAALGLDPVAPGTERSPHILGVPLPSTARPDLLDVLGRQGCHVALRGTTLRMAPHLHVTDADVEHLVTALARAL